MYLEISFECCRVKDNLGEYKYLVAENSKIPLLQSGEPCLILVKFPLICTSLNLAYGALVFHVGSLE